MQKLIRKLLKRFANSELRTAISTPGNVPVSRASFQKHLGIYLDKKPNFNLHIKEKMTKVMKAIGVIKTLGKMLPRHALLTIYKSFVQPHLDYGDILYDQPNNKSLCKKIEIIHYNTALVNTGAIKSIYLSN